MPKDVFDAMRKRRMYRHFVQEPLSEEVLQKLVYAAGRAPVARADLRHIVVVNMASASGEFRGSRRST